MYNRESFENENRSMDKPEGLTGTSLPYSTVNDSNQQDQHQKEIEKIIDKFTTLIENSRDVLYSVYVKPFGFEYLSPSVYELTGYTQDELIHMAPLQMFRIIHPDFRHMYVKYWKSLKNRINTQHYTIEYKIRPKLGISRWLSDNHKVISDSKGEIVKLVGNIRDITDFKLVEEALNRSRDRLFKAIEATNDGMWDWRVNTDKVYFDARFYTMMGYEPLEFQPAMHEWMDRIHPDDIRNVKQQLEQHLTGRSGQWLIEYRFLAKNGEWVWVLNKGKVFERDENGSPLRMVGTHSDISLRKKTEEELQKRNDELETIYEQLQISEEKFRQLAENTEDVFWLRDDDRIIYINPAFDKIWGRDREEVILDPMIVKQWVHPEDQGFLNMWMGFEAFKKQQYILEKFRIFKPDGEIRWLWSRMFAVFNDSQQIIRIAGITTDITEQKLTEEALITAKEKALESDHLKSAFLANISHEIRTPMNGIIGFAELLKDNSLTADVRDQYVNVITKSSEQLLHIIDDIIDISKIEANQLKLNKIAVTVASLLKDLKLFFDNEKAQIGKHNVQLVVEFDPMLDEFVVYTDESRLRQVFMNLIYNALKFTDYGNVKFGFNLRTNDQVIEFFVKDSGIGIAPDQQANIFKRFRQLDDAHTRKFGGTGLGLAICEGLIKLLGGQIWVKSEQGKGSQFFFTIPLAAKAEIKTKIKKGPVFVESYNWAGKSILIVEDDEVNQEFLVAVLSPTSAKIHTAVTGEEAVKFCKSGNPVDLVLMDIRLPKMNGFDAFAKIREVYPEVPVIAQTAFAMSEDATRCLDVGFSDYVSKPINRKHLLAMINRLMIEKI